MGGMTSLITQFAASNTCTTHGFLGLKSWFHYLPQSDFNSDCTINQNFKLLGSNGSDSPLLSIGLAVLDDLLTIAALVALGFVVYGGIQFVTSQGSPDSVSKARQTIINALIGLAVAVVATAIVAFIGDQLGG